MSVRPSICIDAVYEGVAEQQAIEAVAELGFSAIEFWMWWEKDLDHIMDVCTKHEVSIAACCTKFVSLVDPACRAEYLEGLAESIAAAQKLGCKTLISQVGDFREGVSRSEQHECLVEGLKAASELLVNTEITLAIEPLNELVDHPGYYLIRSDETFKIIDAVANAHVKTTFDIYHQQISEGNLISNIVANIDKIAHFHAAGNPGRHELTQGEINYPLVLDAIRKTDYSGYIGLEYWPKASPEVGLKEVATWF